MTTTTLSPELLQIRRPTIRLRRGISARYQKLGGFTAPSGVTRSSAIPEGLTKQRVLIEARERYLAMPEAPQFHLHANIQPPYDAFEGVIETRRRRALCTDIRSIRRSTI